MCEADFVIWDFIEDRKVKARKQHQCHECGAYCINPGDSYRLKKWKDDDGLQTYRCCALCQAVGVEMDKRVDYVRAFGCLASDCAEDLPADEDGCYHTGRKAVLMWARLNNIEASAHA